MIRFDRVKFAKRSPETREIKRLYRRAFPRSERMPFRVLRRTLFSPLVYCFAYYDGDVFVGFAYLVADNDLAYLFYLAVTEEERGKGYGTSILRSLRGIFSQTMVLDIEECDPRAKNAAQRFRRRDFYERNGFVYAGFKATYYGVCYESFVRGGTCGKERLVQLFKKYRREVLGERNV